MRRKITDVIDSWDRSGIDRLREEYGDDSRTFR